MKITNELIKSLNPCKDRLDNYINHYSNIEHNKIEFLNLNKISYEDKIWVSLRLVDKTKLMLIGADIAEAALNIFEANHQNDSRFRDRINKVKSGEAYSTPNDLFYTSWYASYAKDNHTDEKLIFDIILKHWK